MASPRNENATLGRGGVEIRSAVLLPSSRGLRNPGLAKLTAVTVEHRQRKYPISGTFAPCLPLCGLQSLTGDLS